MSPAAGPALTATLPYFRSCVVSPATIVSGPVRQLHAAGADRDLAVVGQHDLGEGVPEHGVVRERLDAGEQARGGVEREADLRSLGGCEGDELVAAPVDRVLAQVPEGLRALVRQQQHHGGIAAQVGARGGERARGHRRHDLGDHVVGEARVGGDGPHLGGQGARALRGRERGVAAAREVLEGPGLDRAREERAVRQQALALAVAGAAAFARDVLDLPQGVEAAHGLDARVEHLARFLIGPDRPAREDGDSET